VSVSGRATASVGSPTLTLSQSTVGGPVPTVPASFSTGAIQSFAFSTGLPNANSVQTSVLTPHPIFNATLPNNGMSRYLGAASLGVARASTGQLQAYDTMIDFQLPFSSLDVGTHFDVALHDPVNFNPGAFSANDSVKITILTNFPNFNISSLGVAAAGVTTLAQLDALFNNQIFDLGGIPVGLAGTFDFSFDIQMLTADPTGFAGDILLATVPEPASYLLFGTGLIGWMLLRRRRRGSDGRLGFEILATGLHRSVA
jgi:hypothetical protein